MTYSGNSEAMTTDPGELLGKLLLDGLLMITPAALLQLDESELLALYRWLRSLDITARSY